MSEIDSKLRTAVEKWEEERKLEGWLPSYSREQLATSLSSLLAERVKAAEESGRSDMLRWILSSLIEYPNGGGDQQIMTQVERLLLDARIAEAKWWRFLTIHATDSYFAVEGDSHIAELERQRDELGGGKIDSPKGQDSKAGN